MVLSNLKMKVLVLWALSLVAPAAAQQFPAAKPRAESLSATYEVDPMATRGLDVTNYDSIFVPLTADRPVGITEEPAYRTSPRYAIVRVGNGPKSTYFLAVDEPEGQDYRLYVDLNRNGDLTDDGDGFYGEKSRGEGKRFIRDPRKSTLYTKSLRMRVSWGSAGRETSSGDYGVQFDRVIQDDERAPEKYRSYLRMRGNAAGVGTVEVGGKPRKAMLVTEALGADYPIPTRPVHAPDQPISEAAKKYPQMEWLVVDLDGNGAFDRGGKDEYINLIVPFELAGVVYEATWAEAASQLILTPTTKTPENVLLPVGTVAPDFSVEARGGGRLKLLEFKGKVIVLDFWGTWCRPCLRGLPHLEEVYQATKDQGVIVFAVATTDSKDQYERWLGENEGKYSLTFAYDDSKGNDIAYDLYQAIAMPTTYVINKDGRVSAAFGGYGDGDTRVEEALMELGIAVQESKIAAGKEEAAAKP